MKRISKIVVVQELDTDCPPDWLGHFSDEAGEYAIEHKSTERHAYKFFNAENVENMEQAQENYARMMAYEHQEWYMTGVYAKAVIETGDGNTWLSNTIRSGGLYGIESDALDADEYPREVGEEQRAELAEVLKELGFTDAEINAAPVELKEWR